MNRTTQPRNTARLLTGSYLIVFFTNIFVALMQQQYNSTIALHMDAIGLGTAYSGIVVAAGAIGTVWYRFVGGRVTDRVGRRRTVLFGMLIFAVMNLCSAFSVRLWQLLLFRILQMMGYSIASTGLAIMVVDVTPQTRTNEGIGYYGLGMSLSGAIGPSIAMALFHTSYAFRAVMGFTVVLAIIGMASMSVCSYEKREDWQKAQQQQPQQTNGRGLWRLLEKRAIPATLLALCFTLGISILTFFLLHFAEYNGIANAGMFFTVSAICTIISRLFSGRLGDRFGTLSCVVPGLLMCIVSFLLLPFSPRSQALYLLAGGLYGLGSGMATPALNAAAIRAASYERRSAASSTFLLSYDLAYAFGTPIWGALLEVIPYSTCFLIAGGMVTLTLILSVLFLRRPHEDSRRQPEPD